MASEVTHAVGPGIKELFTGIHLLIVIGVIYFAARKGVALMIKTRARTVEKEIVDARVELEKMKHETERARQEIAQISKTRERFIAEIKDEGEKLYATMVADAKATSQRILADAKLAAENEVTSAMSKVKEDIVNRAVQKAVAIVADSPDTRGKLHGRLFDRLTADIINHAGDIKHGI